MRIGRAKYEPHARLATRESRRPCSAPANRAVRATHRPLLVDGGTDSCFWPLPTTTRRCRWPGSTRTGPTPAPDSPSDPSFGAGTRPPVRPGARLSTVDLLGLVSPAASDHPRWMDHRDLRTPRLPVLAVLIIVVLLTGAPPASSSLTAAGGGTPTRASAATSPAVAPVEGPTTRRAAMESLAGQGLRGGSAARAAAGTDVVRPGSGVWPLRPRPLVRRRFDPPAVRWGRGHRGVDLAGRPGQRVSAALAGRVTYAGRLAGRGVVVVDHGATRTTYEPVTASVRVGDRVAAGGLVGRLELFGSHCFPRACLHWGLIQGRDRYLDPLSLLGAAPVILLPLTDDAMRPTRGVVPMAPWLLADGLRSGATSLSWPASRAPTTGPSQWPSRSSPLAAW